MGIPGGGFLARAHPDKDTELLMASGQYRPHWPSPGLGWWAHGALVIDDVGPALIDADGQRHPLSLEGAAKLCSVEEFTAGSGPSTYHLFVTDAGDNVLVELPPITCGWDEAELKELAYRAGLEYEAWWLDKIDAAATFPRALRTPSLRGAIHDKDQRERALPSRMGRLLRHRP
ncbi:MAG TPA: hypothetical protein VK425_10940 [Acidimicrobiales bacterium]|nr:hypothetical protein [Acidimicrobiales bacterium]